MAGRYSRKKGRTKNLALVNAHRSMSVSDIQQRLGVSRETVRRDLVALVAKPRPDAPQFSRAGAYPGFAGA